MLRLWPFYHLEIISKNGQDPHPLILLHFCGSTFHTEMTVKAHGPFVLDSYLKNFTNEI